MFWSATAQRVLLAVIVVLFCVRNLPWHLDDFDQAKQAYVSFEMVTRGNWWFQHTPSQNIATKPPLAGWISAALFLTTRWWDGAWRVPSLVSGLLVLLALARLGNRLWPGIGGSIAAGVFGLNLMAPRLATLVRTDMLLTAFIFFAGMVVYEKVRSGSPWRARERWTIFLLILGSMLTKGPIAYAFLLPGLVVFWWICRARRVHANAWSGAWTWFGPLLFFVAWAVAGIFGNREFYEQVVLKEFLGRFTVGEQAVHRNQPVYFYLTHILRDFAPWTFLLIALPFLKSVRRMLLENRTALWLVCWSVGGLVVMSVVPSKRPDRIFPVVPPLCLLLVHGLRELHTSSWPAKRVVAVCIAVALFASGGYTVFNIVKDYRSHEGLLAEFGARVRERAQQNGLRYLVTTSKDEGMLLYLRKAEFSKPRDAIAAWKAGEIDALVLNKKDFENGLSALAPWLVADQSGVGASKNSQYFFVVRNQPQ
ncbi:MAG: hypothetical protein QOD99_3031 [Chthoniobacter sp.]|jgi:4-amino-4-deoxy-L-arabinose transferase-like glycosyltransferase|nr:hypothetical protein [Chthoniobacter sp.]